ncbi:MAG: carboxypeptidase-like regulatory domain-containing protein [Myxococcota bacterium]
MIAAWLAALVVTASPVETRQLSVYLALPDGTPVAGATVTVSEASPALRAIRRACDDVYGCLVDGLAASNDETTWSPPPQVALGKTDKNGHVQFPAVPRRTLYVRAVSKDLQAATHVDGNSWPAELDLTLTRMSHRVVAVRNRAGLVPKARIHVFSERGFMVATTVTDENGRALVPQSNAHITLVRHAGHRVAVSHRDATAWLATTQLCGVVMDEGQPAAGAVVHGSVSVPSVTTDNEGRFCMNVPRVGAILWAERGGKASLGAWWVSPFNMREIVLHLDKARSVRGSVVDEHGRAVPGAEIHVSRSMDEDGEDGAEPILYTEADDAGRFSLPVLPDMELTVDVEAPGHTAVSKPLVAEVQELELRKTHRFRVRLTHAGAPVHGAGLSVRSLPGSPSWSLYAESHRDGWVHLEAPRGAYAVTASSTGGEMRLSVPRMKEVELPVRFPPVTVRVVRDNEPTNGRVITAGEDTRPLAYADDGVIRFLNDPANGALEVVYGEEKVAFQPGSRVVQLMDSSTVTVKATLDGKPAPQTEISRWGEWLGVTGADGTLQVKLRKGEEVSGWRIAGNLTGDAEWDGEAKELEVQLKSLVKRVRVVDAQDQPIPRVAWDWREWVTTENGEVDAEVLGEETLSVRLEVPSATTRTENKDGKIIVHAEPCGTILGTLKDARGQPYAARMLLVPNAPAPMEGDPDEEPPSTWSDERGLFFLECVPAGSHTLKIGGIGVEQEVQVVAGTISAPIRVTMPDGEWLEVTGAPGMLVKVWANDPVPVAEGYTRKENDDDPVGVVKLGPLKRRQYGLRAERDGATWWRSVDLGRRNKAAFPARTPPGRVELQLREGYEVTSVVAWAAADGQRVRGELLGTWMKQGRLAVRGMNEGPYWLTITGTRDGKEFEMRTGVYVGTTPVRLALVPRPDGNLELVPEDDLPPPPAPAPTKEEG